MIVAVPALFPGDVHAPEQDSVADAAWIVLKSPHPWDFRKSVAVETLVREGVSLQEFDASSYNVGNNGIDMNSVNQSGGDFRNANLAGVSLIGANLVRADFSKANLRGANLFCADISNANFEGADLRDATLGCPDDSRVNPWGADGEI